MAGRGSSSIDDRIEKAQENVVRTKAKYDEAVAALKELLAKKKAMQNEELLKIFENSNKTYDEVVSFLTEGRDASCIDEVPKKKRGRKPKG